MASEGLILDISNEFLENLKKADKAIEKIANVSDNSKQRIIQMFQDIDKYGISHVIDKTNEMKRGLELLANANIEVKGLKKIQSNAENAIDKINKLVSSLNNMPMGKQDVLSYNKYESDKNIENIDRRIQAEKDMASIRTRNHQQYQRELEEMFRLEDAKMAEAEKRRQQNQQVKNNSQQAKQAYEEQLRMYSRMFDEIERREQKYASERDARNQKQKQDKLKQLSDEIKAYQEYQERIKRLEQQRIERQSRNRADRYAYTQRYGDTSNQAIAAYKRLYSENSVRSVQQMNKVISQMQQAQQKLNLNTAEGEKRYYELGAKIRRVQRDLNQATGASEKFKKSQQSLSNITGQLGRQLATVFSVQQIVNYAKQVVNVRKEFELQHKSLQIILKDQDEANKLWQQTVDLALKSPFRVKELVKYTKQLAAYRIETEKLHDTTRMLADISAGVGVDMQRLILAYGQVRAAEFLRGTELRQFTEAGVPLLDELATYFTELEGKAVSTAEVFARISKRQVLFEDVESVLQKMTGVTDGVEGVFYKMQERQAQTLHGMISNLHDSIDLMMNDIGKSNDSMMKDMVSLAKTVVDNWRVLAVVIQQVGAVAVIIGLRKAWASFLTLSPQIFATSKNISALSLSMNGVSMSTKRMAVAIRALTKAMLTNPFFIGTTALVAIASITHAFYSFNKSIKETNKKYDEQAHAIVRSMDKLNKYKQTVAENNNVIEDSSSAEDKVIEARGKNAAILAELQKLYPENFENIKLNTDGTLQLNEALKSQNELLEQQILLNELSKATFLHEDLQQNYSDVVEALGEVESGIVSTKASMISLKKELLLRKDAGKISSADYDNIIGKVDAVQVDKGYDEVKSAVDDLYKELEKLDRKHRIELGDISRESLAKMAKGYDHYEKDLETLGDNLDKFIDNVIVNTQRFEDNIGKSEWIDDMLEHLGIADKEIRKWAGEYIAKKIDIEFVLGEEKTKTYTTADFLHGWQHQIWNAIEEIGKIEPVVKQQLRIDIEDIVFAQSATEIREKLEKTLPNLFDEQQNILKWEDNTSQLVYSPETIENAEKLTFALQTLMEILALEPNKKNTYKKGEDIYAKRIKMIRDMARSYEELNDTFSNSEAEKRVIESYTNAFAELFNGIMDIQNVDFTTPEGVIAALEVLKKSAKLTAEQIRDVETAIAEVSTDKDVKATKENQDVFKDKLENMFGQYEVSLEFDDLRLPPDLFKFVTGEEFLTLDGLEQKVKDAYAAIPEEQKGEDMAKIYTDALNRIADYREKWMKEEGKKIIDFYLKNIDEVEKITKEKEILESIAVDALNKGAITIEEFSQIIKSIAQDTNEKLSKISLDKFKASGDYIMAMGNLAALSSKQLKELKKRLEDIVKAGAKNMTPEELKEYKKAIDRITKAQEKQFDLFTNTPFGKVAELAKLLKKYSDEEAKLKKEEDKKSSLEEDLEVQKQMYEYAKSIGNESIMGDHSKKIADIQGNILDSENSITSINSKMSNISGEMGNITGGAGAAVTMIDMIVKGIYQGIKAVIEMYNEIKDLAESFGEDVEKGSWRKATLAFEAIGEINDNVMNAWERLKSGDGLGSFVASIAVILDLIKWINKGIDSNINETMQETEERIEFLTKVLEKLERSIEKTGSLLELENLSSKASTMLEEQIASYDELIELEKAKKDTDREKVEELIEERETLQEELEDFYDERFSDVTGGILDSTADVASEFVDTWLESFKEVGDGLDGLEEAADEMISNLIKKQIALSVVQPYMERWKKELEKYIDPKNGDLTSSVDEANKFADKVRSEVPLLSQSLENVFTAMGDLVDLTGEDGELAGLQKGIEGITEVQAEEITAYLNSLRFYVAQESEALVNLANKVLSTDETVNPMLAQLRIIASQTTAINELLNSLTTPFANGGIGFKVVL